MIYYGKSVALIAMFFAFSSASFGLNIGIFSNKKSAGVDQYDETTKFIKLLYKEKLPKNKQQKLALWCLDNPLLCTDKALFNKINPNLNLPDGNSFIRISLKHFCGGNFDLGPLLWEALKHPLLDPHKIDKMGNDLALEIMLNEDLKFISMLLEHRNFNPNAVYGNSKTPLSAVLISAEKFEALKILLEHPQFDRSVADLAGLRPGHLLLKGRINRIKEYLFRTFMGKALSQWNLTGLGLTDNQLVNILFKRF